MVKIQQINLVAYDERMNKNNQPFVMVKDTNNDMWFCNEQMFFEVLKTSAIINAEVVIKPSPDGQRVFRNINLAEQLQSAPGGELPKIEKKQWSGGRAPADPKQELRIVRENVLSRGVEIALELHKTGELDVKDKENAQQTVLRSAVSIATYLEKWVYREEQTQTPVGQAAQAQPAPTPPPRAQVQPIGAAVTSGQTAAKFSEDDFSDLPF